MCFWLLLWTGCSGRWILSSSCINFGEDCSCDLLLAHRALAEVGDIYPVRGKETGGCVHSYVRCCLMPRASLLTPLGLVQRDWAQKTSVLRFLCFRYRRCRSGAAFGCQHEGSLSHLKGLRMSYTASAPWWTQVVHRSGVTPAHSRCLGHSGTSQVTPDALVNQDPLSVPIKHNSVLCS